MAATIQQGKKKSQVHRRQQNKTQRRTRGGKTARRPAKHGHGKKHIARRPSRKIPKLRFGSVRMTNEAQNILHFSVHDLYRKVSLAAERLRKKKQHVSITVSDVRNALKKILPRRYDKRPVSSFSCKCH